MSAPLNKTSKPALSGKALHQAIHDGVGKHLDLRLYQVFIFGSEATADAAPGSDIDIGFVGPERLPSKVLDNIRTELESLRTLRLFDLVDFSCVDESFKAVALKKIQNLNE